MTYSTTAPSSMSSDGNSINYADSPFAELVGAKESKNDYTAFNMTNGGLKSFYYTDLYGMTLGEVMKKQENREMFAVGRFQVIPSTLKEAAEKLKLDPTAKFDKSMQDKIFNDYLIAQKRPEIKKFLQGIGSIEEALLGAAKEWAALPVAPGTRLRSGVIAKGGESYYAGDGLNKSGTNLKKVQQALIASCASIWPTMAKTERLIPTTQDTTASRPSSSTLAGADLASQLNVYLFRGETPWPFPGSPSKATLEQRRAKMQEIS